MNADKPLISVENLQKLFTLGNVTVDVLNGLTFEVCKGEMLAIVGVSGAGKSTLMHILGTLDRPTKGTVYFEGEDIFSYSPAEMANFRNQKVGFVFQFNQLLPEFTALENIIMPALIKRKNRRDAVDRGKFLLQEVGLGERLNHKPGELSGGEQQRVAIARALMNEPAIVLADEPTGNLDRKTGGAINHLIRSLNDRLKQTFIVVTHNEQLASSMDRILTIVDGKAICKQKVEGKHV